MLPVSLLLTTSLILRDMPQKSRNRYVWRKRRGKMIFALAAVAKSISIAMVRMRRKYLVRLKTVSQKETFF